MSVPPHPPRSEELLRLLLDQSEDHALLLLDAGGKIVSWLAGAEHIFGYRAEEMLGQPASRLFTPGDVDRGLAEMLPRIFELFTQEESSRSRSEGGLGLGLPLVKDLVTLHGGTVQVRSEGRGKGSEFTVRLPLQKRVGTGTSGPPAG